MLRKTRCLGHCGVIQLGRRLRGSHHIGSRRRQASFQSSNRYPSYPSEYQTMTVPFHSGADRSNTLNNGIDAAAGWLGMSVEDFPYPSQLPSASTSSLTSLTAPGTNLADNLGPPYSTAVAPSYMFPLSTITQYPVHNNIHYSGYRAPDHTQLPRLVEEGYNMAFEPLFWETPPAQVGAHAPWLNAFPAQYEPSTTIHNGTFIGGSVNNNVRNGESGINILHRIVATEAFHDPADGHAQPRCHPETRIEMQEKLWKWYINSEWPSKERGTESYDTEPTILWVHGPAGARKSAIMETLSRRLEKAGRLGGAFFFKRRHSTHGSAKVLFSTIALQLAVNSPRLKLQISRTVEENPTLVNRSIGVQLEELILKPCLGLESPPWIIIIDGLDECEGQNVQQDILRLIGDSTQQRTPLRFIIASRLEAHIREVFVGLSGCGLYREFDVESSFDDVRTYLVSEFARIHREHSTLGDVSPPWPSEEVIDRLVRKSSGYFIYASTVIKFVDDKNHRSTQRLGAIENRNGTRFQSPFSALDELYPKSSPRFHTIVILSQSYVLLTT
ncbi:hypothetical protein DFH09DRAFT_527357 [Mycena vulgaris]|nr:hypothetical protein DFH09DRAFT_527357 [Mycena vulgaris]